MTSRLSTDSIFRTSVEQKTRSQSARRPKPRYVKPMIETFPTSTRPLTATEYNSSVDIREQAYLSWYKERTERAKKERREKEKKEEEERKKKEEEEKRKKEEAKLAFEAWEKEKKQHDKDKNPRRLKEKEEEKKEKELQEKQEKKEKAATVS